MCVTFMVYSTVEILGKSPIVILFIFFLSLTAVCCDSTIETSAGKSCQQHGNGKMKQMNWWSYGDTTLLSPTRGFSPASF